MADVRRISFSKSKTSFVQAIGSEKHERVARKSLSDIIVFYQAIEKEMQQMQQAKSQNQPIDDALLTRMEAVKEHYHCVMTGFLELDDNSQRHVLITFADKIQDLMKYLHMRRNA